MDKYFIPQQTFIIIVLKTSTHHSSLQIIKQIYFDKYNLNFMISVINYILQVHYNSYTFLLMRLKIIFFSRSCVAKYNKTNLNNYDCLLL